MAKKQIVVQVLRGVGGSIAAVGGLVSQGAKLAGCRSEALVLRYKQKSVGEEVTFDAVHYCDYSTSHWRGYRLRLFIGLWKYFKKNKTDIIVAHQYKEFVMLLLLQRLFKSFKLMIVFHGERDLSSVFRRWWCRRLLNDNCHLVAVSESVKTYVLDSLPHLSNDQVSVINNGVDFDWIKTNQLSKEQARAELGLDQDRVIYGTMGRLAYTKGPDVLLKAFAKIKSKDDPPLLVYMGEGREQKLLLKLAEDLGVDNRVIFLGKVFQGAKFLKAFDCFVFPSRREGFGLALVEAVAARVPVVFSDLNVFRALTKEHKYMARSGDVGILAKKIEEAMFDGAEQRALIAEKQYIYAKEHFSIDKTVISYSHYLSEFMIKKGGAAGGAGL